MRRHPLIGAALLIAVMMVATCLIGIAGKPPPPPPPPQTPKLVSFGVCEDYDKGQDLNGIALDFQLLNQLEIDTMRVSFGWDDYEPARGQYDFVWLQDFCALANQYGIKLRPYICYAPEWAGNGSWNSPPNNYQDWYNFCYNLALALKPYTNVMSYEIWNEENDTPNWWGGTLAQYMELLKQGATAIRAADPGKTILIGGYQWPDDAWMNQITAAGYAQYYEVTPIHCYYETWTTPRYYMENYCDARYQSFVTYNNTQGQNEPIWMNEIGYATYYKTEDDQANFMCRAVSYLFADPEIEHISWYEIKDLDPNSPAIGDAANYYLGITYWPDRRPKKAFHTLDMLTDLLDKKTITPADAEATVTITAGRSSSLYKHLFKLADGSQVLFVYSKASNCTVSVKLATPGLTAYRYDIFANTSSLYSNFTNNTIAGLALTAGNVEVFKILP